MGRKLIFLARLQQGSRIENYPAKKNLNKINGLQVSSCGVKQSKLYKTKYKNLDCP